ncbi:MAG: glutaredoxin family protein, partial [Prochlorococcus sp.]
ILHVIDIDGAEISAELRGRYDLEVPVLALSGGDLDCCVSLPRVSPRLRGTGLRDWLQKQLRQLADRG